MFGIVVMSISNNDFQLLFLLAGIPAAFATLILIMFVKEKRDEHHNVINRRKIKFSDLK